MLHMKWFFGGTTGYSFIDVWTIVHLAFWVFAGSVFWSLKCRGFWGLAICLALAFAWEVFERYAEKKWPHLWLNPESPWNAYISDPLTCVLGVLFIWWALDNLRVS